MKPLIDTPSLRSLITSLSLLMSTFIRKLFGRNIRIASFLLSLRMKKYKLAMREGTFCFLH